MSAVKWIEAEKGMKKKMTVLTLCATLFALCLPAEAQQPKKVPPMGFLGATPPALTP
jgi:hypothetical protein